VKKVYQSPFIHRLMEEIQHIPDIAKCIRINAAEQI
jgi:hypothetical protein